MTEKARILICDDEPGIRDAFELIFAESYTLDFADHGQTALRRIAEQPPDLVILDLKMPDIDGLEVLNAIKADYPKIKILIVTGYQSVEMAKVTLQAGADDYIPKPFDRTYLESAVRRLLEEEQPVA